MALTALHPTTTAPEPALLRILLGDPRLEADDVDWSRMLPLAGRHRVLLRLADWFTRKGETPPAAFARAFVDARERQCKTLGMVAQLDAYCTARDLDYVMPVLVQDAPDLGRGVALLVSGPPPDVDSEMFLHAPASPRSGVLRRRFARSMQIDVPAHDATLDVHFGRLGRVGEHQGFAQRVLARRQRALVGDVACCVPSREDELLIHTLRFMYGRPVLRLRDAHWLMATLTHQALDWDYLTGTAQATGLFAGLSCLLDYAGQIHLQVLGRALFGGPRHGALFAPGRWGRVSWQDGAWAFPAGRIGRRLLAQQLFGALARRNLAAAGRLAFVPVVAAYNRHRRLGHARRP